VPVISLFIGMLIVLEGVLGLVTPELFVEMVRRFQVPPVIYVAIVLRVAFGTVIFLAAPRSRSQLALRCIGGLIAAGGVLSVFVGQELAQLILRHWEEGGTAIVRVWAGGALCLGAFIAYATMPTRHARESRSAI